jgi:superfamily I DNA/RNA helicase
MPFATKAIASSGLTRGPAWLLDEIDTVIAGRGISSESDYLAVDRAGRGDPLTQAERATVYGAAAEYHRLLEASGLTDFPRLRLRAAELAEAGGGPRFDAVIIDEAQDLTLAHIRLLKALDRHADHRAFMVVGDGQQAVYPGGFSLRAAGLDVRGRSFVLRTNWRNTQRIADAARLVLGPQGLRDLERDGEDTSPDGAPPRRLGVDPELHLVGGREQADEILKELLWEVCAGADSEEMLSRPVEN